MLSTVKKRRYLRKHFSFVFCVILIPFLYVFGLFTHIFELDYDTEFSYPLKRNIVDCTVRLSNQLTSDCPVINSYNYDIIIKNENKCPSNEAVHLLLIIKSAVNHYNRRAAIRDTWGYENRFSDVVLKRVFVLGVTDENYDIIQHEQDKYSDIVQVKFTDTYFNNTVKTMTSFKWAVEHCPNAKFYLFSDDDMYISIKNLLRFLRNPTEYPRYLQISENAEVSKFINKRLNYELPENVKLFSGFVYQSAPHRHQCSKWYVSLEEYPYDKWPPYASAGSYILSKEALKLMYYASFFTKHFRFDDVYLGLLAKKVGIELFHCAEFRMFRNSGEENLTYALSSHGYEPEELVQIWSKQKMLGNA